MSNFTKESTSFSSLPIYLSNEALAWDTDNGKGHYSWNIFFRIYSKINLGPVVQSVVSLTSSLRVISLTVLADSIYNILIFFAEKMWVAFAHFFSKKFRHIRVSLDVNFNESLTNDVVSFEQLGPGHLLVITNQFTKFQDSRANSFEIFCWQKCPKLQRAVAILENVAWCFERALLPSIFCLGRLCIASKYIFNLWQLRQGVDSLAQWLEHWIFYREDRVRIPRWEIFFSYASFLCYDFHVVRWGLVRDKTLYAENGFTSS